MPLLVLVALLASFMALTARAQAVPETGPALLAAAVKADAGAVLADVADLIAAYGDGTSVTAAGIAAHVGLERAAARALTLRGFIAADLDGDGLLAGPEARVAMDAMTARARARFARDMALADVDGDGSVAAPEQRAMAEAAAFKRVSAREAALLAALMLLDADRDGALTLGEASLGVATFGDGA